MDVTLALLADYANVSREGKLNVLGIFNVVLVQSLPGGVPMCHLVLRFVADAAEKGARKSVEFKLLDPDGRPVVGQLGEIDVPADGQPGPAVMDILSPTPWLKFEQHGPHRLCVLVNGETKASIELNVAPAPGATEEPANGG